MKRLAFAIGISLWTTFAAAQTLLTNPTLQGSAAASTLSVEDVYTRGGSPRGGYYHYWKPVTKQSTNATVPFAFNAATGDVTSTGNYFTPSYAATTSGSTTLSNLAKTATFKFTGQNATTVLPPLVAHQHCTVIALLTPRFYFSVPNDTIVTITYTGAAPSEGNFYALSGEIGPGENGKPNSYIVTGGGSYCFYATWKTVAGSTALTAKGGFNLKFSLPK
jgi:hypothetical protein